VNQVLLRLCNGDSSGTQEGERLSLEACTRGVVRDSTADQVRVFIELSTVKITDRQCNSNSAI
jgi:hypothetical protein